MLLALLACVEPTKPAWSTQADPTVERDTSEGVADDSGADTAVDTATQDSGAADTADSAGDTGVVDTADSGADTGATDTAADTSDTGATDTSDTGATDTGATDTGYSVAADAPADWILEDINPGSYRFGEPISPRDYISRVSGYYFIHST